MHYEANYAYPVVVWLHSNGGDEKQLLRVMPHVSMRNYVGVGVRASFPCDGRGYQWQQSSQNILTAENRVQEAIAAAQAKFNVNADRIFLAGHEAGGTMAFRLALRSPRKYAGALSAGGRFPLGQMPLESALYGTTALSPTAATANCLRGDLCHDFALHRGLRSPSQYPCGDELTTQCADMDAWMMGM
jgi:phospholipase/carboxylesterase